jgi:macrolide transport system ATP-binding/permease protein
MRLIRRLWYLVRQRRFEADLAQELEVHRDLAQRELEQSGLTSAKAAVEAQRRLGNAALIRDDARDVWGWTWLQDISQDLRFAGRRLMKDARFTVAVVFALGLGIGANNSVFTVINTALIRVRRAGTVARFRRDQPRWT